MNTTKKKNVVRLTESDLHRIIKESVNEVFNNQNYARLEPPTHINDTVSHLHKILQDAERKGIGIEELCDKLHGHNLTNDMFDLNIGSYTMTICMKPKYIISPSYEEWDDEGPNFEVKKLY